MNLAALVDEYGERYGDRVLAGFQGPVDAVVGEGEAAGQSTPAVTLDRREPELVFPVLRAEHDVVPLEGKDHLEEAEQLGPALGLAAPAPPHLRLHVAEARLLDAWRDCREVVRGLLGGFGQDEFIERDN